MLLENHRWDKPEKKPGRPKAKEPRNRGVKIRMTDKEYYILDKMAREMKCSKADIVRVALAKHRGDLFRSGHDV